MKHFFKEFGEFIRRGSVIDLAVGIILGTAFNAIVKSLVNDIIMPLVGGAGGINFADAKIILVDAVIQNNEVVTPAVTLNYGAFIQSIIDFIIIAFSIFMIIKIINKIRQRFEHQKEEVNKPTTEGLLTEIRDLLKNNH